MSRKNRKKRKHVALFSRRSLPGSAPGTLIVDPNAPTPVIRLMAFSPDKLFEKDIEDLQTVLSFINQWSATWVNVAGLGDLSVITKLGESFNLHRLALEHARAGMELGLSICFGSDGPGSAYPAALLPDKRLAGETELIYVRFC